MKKRSQLALALGTVLGTAVSLALAAPAASDRVYTADQNTNTVSVINPATNMLLGQIRLGNARPDILSPLYKGEINVHGLGFSPDHKTLIAISNGSNSAAFIDTATNKIKGIAYIGRSPHEGFFTADGKEAWVVVRGENYISVIDPATYKETRRIETAPGPGMVLFHPNGKLAFVVSSFTPVVDVIDVARHQVVRRIPVVSPFSPFLQFTPDHKEVWMTHKDVGKVTRIDTQTLQVKGVIDTGFITNHLGFAKTARGTLAYVTVGGENVVKVYTTDAAPRLLATTPVGALPHGIWPSDDGTRMYVGLENGDGVDVIDTATDKVIARVPVGQAPQALVYVSNAVPAGDGMANLAPRANGEPVNISLKPTGAEGRGFVVARNLGLVDALEVFLYKLKPHTVYNVYVTGQRTPVASFRTNAAGTANGTAMGPLREAVSAISGKTPAAARLLVVEGDTPAVAASAVLVGAQ
ncbi:putative exported protein, Nitrous oxide reductase N-terminal domain [Cupriavidus necator]|uniref:Putative exported protein, Nitrous oxide reductase N-terminal domain n=1 Tax=Cupriavidus necator TaxID=106590 RepID=A0A1K0J6I0_CUPNE|nr:putative exported protein, Nitrous oxide reductase N-terminal domain [Cupriavidus necator]